MANRYELVCDEARLYCVIGCGGICGVTIAVDEEKEQKEVGDFLNRTNGKSLRMVITDYVGYDLGYDNISDILEQEKDKRERKVDE